MNLFAITLHFTIIIVTATFTILETIVNFESQWVIALYIQNEKEGGKFNIFCSNLYKTAAIYHTSINM